MPAWPRLLITSALAACVAGCSATMPDLRPIRPSEIRADNPPSLPLLLQFDEGDRIAFDVGIDSGLVDVVGGAGEPTLVVQRRFFVLLTEDGPPRISLDGKTLEQVHGTVQIGFGVTKAGPKASFRLGTNGESP